jgi:hypothetical protein
MRRETITLMFGVLSFTACAGASDPVGQEDKRDDLIDRNIDVSGRGEPRLVTWDKGEGQELQNKSTYFVLPSVHEPLFASNDIRIETDVLRLSEKEAVSPVKVSVVDEPWTSYGMQIWQWEKDHWQIVGPRSSGGGTLDVSEWLWTEPTLTRNAKGWLISGKASRAEDLLGGVAAAIETITSEPVQVDEAEYLDLYVLPAWNFGDYDEFGVNYIAETIFER